MLIKKFKTVLLCIFFCALSLTVACRQTPECEAVVNKIDNPLDVLVMEKADPSEEWSQMEDRIVWNETKTVDNEVTGQYTVDVSIDAETPSRPGRVPVVIIEPERFDIEFLTKTAEYLMPDEIYDGTPSKQDITAEILDFKKDISTHTIREGNQGDVDEYLEILNERYENAADGNSEARFEFNENGYLRLKSYTNSGGNMNFLGYGSSFDFRISDFNRPYTDLNDRRDEDVQEKGMETTFEQARAAADEAMAAVFSEPYAMVHSNVLDKIDIWEHLWSDGEFTSLGQVYEFCYSRVYGGFVSLYIDPAPAWGVEKPGEEETEYSASYPREYASIVADDRGVVKVHYESFSITVETINDDVKLMPFADILERFKDEVFYHNLWGTSKTEIKITRIEFGMVREPIKDDPDRYMMVPAWNFIGDINSGWENEQGISIIALNAINGGVITDYPKIS